MTTTILAAEKCGGMLSQMAQLGWPGVIVTGLFLALIGFVIWVLFR